MRWYIKIIALGVFASNANAMCAIQICVPTASCRIATELIKLVGEELFIKEYFDPIINNSSGLIYRHPASRMLNMSKNEKIKSKGLEAMARLEAQRYYLNKKAATVTTNLNNTKRTQAEAELLLNEIEALHAEMRLYLISDKSNQKIAQGKNKLLGR